VWDAQLHGARPDRRRGDESVRGEATHFALISGHQDPAVEDIVETGEGFLVVANYGAAATVARRTDPRSSSR